MVLDFKNSSRGFFQRRVVVDNKSACSPTTRDKGQSNLSGSSDSRKIVSNLSASKKYIQSAWFLTFTDDHNNYPRLHFTSLNNQKNRPEK